MGQQTRDAQTQPAQERPEPAAETPETAAPEGETERRARAEAEKASNEDG